MAMIAFAFLQFRRLQAAGRKEKSRGATAITHGAGHQASHPGGKNLTLGSHIDGSANDDNWDIAVILT